MGFTGLKCIYQTTFFSVGARAGVNSFLLPFPISRGRHVPCLVVSSFHFQRGQWYSESTVTLSHCFSSTFQDPVISLARIVSSSWGQFISKLDSICNFISPLPCKVTHSQVPGIRPWTFLRYYSVYHKHF